jgi:serine protease Do
MKRKITERLSFLSALAIFGAFVIIFIAENSRAVQDSPPAMLTSFADLADQVKGSVVNISTTQVVEGAPLMPFLGPNSPFGNFLGPDFQKRFFDGHPHGQMKTHALGSGFVISSDGLIITNSHVVEKATEIKIKLQSSKEYEAKLIAKDPKTDLALIRVTPDREFPSPVALGDSDSLRVGDSVMAVGNPFGLGHTVTTGIISAKSRILGAGPYDDFLQTDAAINPGNSGGPLFDMQGKVIGINTAIIAQGQGIGFAIPINMAKDLLPQLKTGKVVRGWIGVMIQDITSELTKSFGLKNAKGVLVSDVVQGSPADKAGLQRGDVIIQFNGKKVENAHKLSQLAAATHPNTTVDIDLVRKGETKNLNLTVATMPSDGQASAVPEEETGWGLTVEELTPRLAMQLGVASETKGVVVSGITDESPADAAGLRRGDIILEVDRIPISNMDDYQQALERVKRGENLLLLAKRGRGTFYIVLKPSDEGEG